MYFYKTPMNSMDFRYMLPVESKAEVFFSMDDDIVIDCKELEKTFKVWQQRAIGDISPIATYAPRGFSFNIGK